MFDQELDCLECAGESDLIPSLDRRDFIRAIGAGVVGVASAGTLLVSGRARAAEDPRPEKPRPAEELVKELHAGFSDEQKKNLVLPFNHGLVEGKGRATRLGMYNSALQNKKIADNYTKGQQELIERILKAISAGDDGYRCISRGGNFDTGGGLRGCGATLFGDPSKDKEWSWVFTGHHLTVRCDGRPADGVGFGGPMYYGHSPSGYSENNVFYFQTKSVMGVYDALEEKQREKAVIKGSPGEQLPSIRFRPNGEARPGLAFADLSKDQKELVEKVMKDLLKPYRTEDVNEVMGIVKDTGGMDKIHLAFYRQRDDGNRWHFWRLEGPGFVWNFRVLPHVHTYVNVARQA
jgi:hypothetical protein